MISSTTWSQRNISLECVYLSWPRSEHLALPVANGCRLLNPSNQMKRSQCFKAEACFCPFPSRLFVCVHNRSCEQNWAQTFTCYCWLQKKIHGEVYGVLSATMGIGKMNLGNKVSNAELVYEQSDARYSTPFFSRPLRLSLPSFLSC